MSVTEAVFELGIEGIIALVAYVWLKGQLKSLRVQVDTLKKDADNLGEIIGTARAIARKSQKPKE